MFRHPGGNLLEGLAGNGKLIIYKIVPRLILAMALSLLFSSLDGYASVNEVISFFMLFGFLAFYLIPPSVDTLYIVKKTGAPDVDELNLLKLLRATKDSSRGVYTLGGSMVIKSDYGKAVKYFEKLKEKYNFEGYDVFRQEKSKKAFNHEYYMLLEGVSWKFMEDPSKAEVVKYNIDNLDAITL